MYKRLPFKNVLNARDLGGYPTADGGATKFGRGLRTDLLSGLQQHEIKILEDMGIDTVIDLRTEFESKADPDPKIGEAGVNYSYPLITDAFFPPEEDGIAPTYLSYADNYDAMSKVMRAIAYANRGFIVHCTAGKDRTGVVCAVLLRLCGVAKADVIADYQLSYTYLFERVKGLKAQYPDLPAFAGQSKAEYMYGFLKLFHEKYDTAEKYCKEIGLTDKEILLIKAKLKD